VKLIGLSRRFIVDRRGLGCSPTSSERWIRKQQNLKQTKTKISEQK
jgi:hypothetical protein